METIKRLEEIGKTQRVRLEEMIKLRKTHPDFTTTGIDVLVLKKIDDMATKEVKIYNEKNKTIKKSELEIEKLKGKDDDESLNKIIELEEIIELNKVDAERIKEDVRGGKKTEEIIKELQELQVANPDNAIRDNLQLVSYVGKELNVPTRITAGTYVQSILDVKFKNNDIRNEFSKRNLNYFDSLRNDSEVVSPFEPGVPRGV